MLRDADGAFRLGPTPLRLGGLYQDAFDLAAQVRPVLARLVERTGETAAFYIRECEQRICLYRHHAPRPIRQHLEEGAALPLDRGAGGRILTAFGGGTSALDASTRTRGFYLSVGERDPETAAIAAPVFTARGLAGALGVTGPRGRIDGDAGPPLTTAVLEEARRLTRVLGGG
jgi:DNA-binding IclR family transcriptional regulator